MNAQVAFENIRSHLDRTLVDGRQPHEIVEAYQGINGLVQDGIIGPVTARHADTPRCCGTPDTIQLTRARWDFTEWTGSEWKNGTPRALELKYFVTSPLAPLDMQKTWSSFATGLGLWSDVCGVWWLPVENARAANIIFNVGPIDGQSDTLAWCKFPPGRETPATQIDSLFDSAEVWSDSLTPAGGRIAAPLTICHEAGHGIGIPHLRDGNLMGSIYNPRILKPQADDITEAQLRYGPPVPRSQPPVTPPPGTPPMTIRVTADFGTFGKYDGELTHVNA